MIHQPKRKRRLIAIDETIIKLENKQIYVWIAIDVNMKEFRHIFSLSRCLKYCENKPEIVVVFLSSTEIRVKI